MERRVCRCGEGVVKGEGLVAVLLLLFLLLVGAGVVADEGGRFEFRDLEGLAILEAGCVVTAGASLSICFNA